MNNNKFHKVNNQFNAIYTLKCNIDSIIDNNIKAFVFLQIDVAYGYVITDNIKSNINAHTKKLIKSQAVNL